MKLQLFAILALTVATGYGWAKDEPTGPVIKTWALTVSGDKEVGKLPLTGQVPNYWERPEVRSGYLTTKEQLTDLWKALGQTEPLPGIDFTKQSLVVIELRASRIRVEKKDDGTPLLQFSISPGKPGQKERHYTLAAMPKETIEAIVKGKKD
jgi:hypothetical protein